MKRVTVLGLLGGLLVSLGMSGEACDINTDPASLNLRGDPAIIATSPGEGSADRTFEVDLRRYGETDRIAWEFGDGSVKHQLTVAQGRRVSHTYQSSGTFTVKVHLFSAPDVVKNEPAQLLATGSLPVDVLGPNVAPVAAFTVLEVAPTEDSVGITRKFVGSRSRDPDGTIVEHRWDFGDGGQAIGSTVEHSYAQAGMYTARLTVKDNRGERGVTERTIFVNGIPEARFRTEADQDNPLLVRFNASRSSDPDGELVRYDWDFGDGNTQPNGGVMTQHVYSAPGQYNARLDVYDDVGGTDFVTVLFQVTTNELLVTSVSSQYGVVDTEVEDLSVEGFNFTEGARVRLERGAARIAAASIEFKSDALLIVDFDLDGADLGDYDVVVENDDSVVARLEDGFRVVTPNRVRLTTSLGEIVFELVDDAPITTANFLQYVEDGFYDGTIFHRVDPNFVVQGGGFLPGMIQPDGLRDPIENEFSPDRSNVRGTVAMAKVGGNPNSATSQFFVNLKDNSDNLDNQNGGFTVFANVVEGMDVVDAIAAVELDGETPVEDVLLIRAERE